MSTYSPADQEFLDKLQSVISKHLSEEQFGVSELAEAVNMSRSNLLRKIKKITGLSASQYIRQVRLEKGMELLKTSSMNVSEVGFKVGFSSTSYFIKCFREQYGFPPGEANKHPEEKAIEAPHPSRTKHFVKVALIGATAILIIASFLRFFGPQKNDNNHQEISIAVLPFINDSNDSTNVYLINGLMESTLSNLQKIKNLRVISRTSSEKYRNSQKSAPEIAKELNVKYLVEGSGQKIGDQIQLHIQLIDAESDSHLWAKQYQNQTKDIFQLQQEVAKNITQEIQVVITPEEAKRIDKVPTENLVAYDYYLKGMEYFQQGKREPLHDAIKYFEKAIEEDPNFALAYADIAIAYYYLDLFLAEKQYTTQLNTYADKALLLDPELANSLRAKALVYMQAREYELAASYLEKALYYNPNSAAVVNMLSDFYTNYVPNTGKYLEYALKGIKLDAASKDSVSASYSYLHLANALIQTGFTDEALLYLDKCKSLYPANEYVDYVRAFASYPKHEDLKQLEKDLLEIFGRDSTRLDVMQDVAKVYYMLEDYPTCYAYYSKFDSLRKAYNLNIYQHEDIKLAFVCRKVGRKEEADQFFKSYQKFLPTDHSIYRSLTHASEQLYLGNVANALELVQAFTVEENYHYWLVLFIDKDPMYKYIMDYPGFEKAFKKIKSKFWDSHDEIRYRLENEGLL